MGQGNMPAPNAGWGDNPLPIDWIEVIVVEEVEEEEEDAIEVLAITMIIITAEAEVGEDETTLETLRCIAPDRINNRRGKENYIKNSRIVL